MSPTDDSVESSAAPPEAISKARAHNTETSVPAAPGCSLSLTSAGSTASTSSINPRNCEDAGTVPSITRFSRFSIAQANSPMLLAPTILPLPLRVWNERRVVSSASRSSELPRQLGYWFWIDCSSSFASSMKISRISASISSPDSASADSSLSAPSSSSCAAVVPCDATDVGTDASESPISTIGSNPSTGDSL